MAMDHRAPAWLALLAALAGCTGEVAPTSVPGWVPAGEERLTFAGGAAMQRSVRFDDGSEIEEYGRAAGDGWQVEYLYLTSDLPDHALAGRFDPAGIPALFRRLAGSNAVPGEAARIQRPEGALSYRPVALAGCFAFAGDWPGRADQALVGYACSTGGEPIAPAVIEALLAGLTVQPVVTPDHLPALPAAPGARGYALGSDRPDRGLTGYPLALTRLSARADAELL